MKNSILRAFYVVDGFEQRYSGSMLFLFENKKRHPCKFLLELQALMSSPEKEGFELPTSKHGRLFSIPLVSRQTPCFSHLPPPSSCPRQQSAEDPTPRGARVPSFFFLKTKKRHQLSLMSSPEKEGFEPSRRVNDLYP